ncbi:MAG: YtcA family lipoprotein [Chthoniobacteraceae bacterium]|jgi:hypothetical protein
MKRSSIRISLIAPLALSMPGCAAAGSNSPTIDVLGSYFPAWMICIIVGLVLTVISRLLLAAFKLDRLLWPAPIVYTCLMVVFTMAVWLAFFRN